VRKLVAEKLKDETDRAKVLARYAPAILEKTEKSPETALRIADFLRRSPIMPQWTKQSLDGASREIRSAEVKFTVLAADTLSRQLTEKLASGTEKEASARPRSVEGVAAGIQVEGLAPADGRRNIDRQESLSGPSYFEHLRAKELDEQRQSLAFGKLREILETFAFETARVKSLDKVRSAVRDEVFQQALKAAVELAKNLIDLRLAPRLLRSLQDPHYRHRFETRSAFALVEAARAEAGLTQAA
jgi:hypothetical protein